jgi:hypothetical protein
MYSVPNLPDCGSFSIVSQFEWLFGQTGSLKEIHVRLAQARLERSNTSPTRRWQVLVKDTAMHPTARQAQYLQIRVDGGDLRGAAGRHSGPDDLNRRI